MEVKQNILFESMKDNRQYMMSIPVGSNLGEVYSVMLEFLDKVVELINEHNQKIKPKEPEVSKPSEEESA